MSKKSLTLFIVVLCLGLFWGGCPKKKVAVSRDVSSVQRAEEAARREREAREAKERELAKLREEELKNPPEGGLEKSLVAKKEPGIEGEVLESKRLKTS